MNGLLAVLRKEFLHVRRERTTLFFALVIPVLQLTLFGYAIDTTVKNIRTVVLDLDRSSDSRRFVESLRNTQTFQLVDHVLDEAAFEGAIRAGRAHVGVRIPPDYSRALLSGRPAVVQVLIDGSNSTVATAALNSAKLLGTSASLERSRVYAEAIQAAAARDATGNLAMPIDVRPRLLYNPNLTSAYFFVPALVGIILQNVAVFLTAFAVVRERELGTLEQLFVTPVSPTGLLLGKLTPYAVLGALETLIVLCVMVFIFGVPIRGDILLLVALSSLFLLTALGLGLLVSTIARTQVQAIQVVFLIVLPSVLLSGFVFPRETMPAAIYPFSFLIPATYFVEILRGVIVRGATTVDLAPHIAGLAICCVISLSLSLLRFRKQLD
ncbi:MAG: ABC transporter permease [Phycisphaerae bacterium]|nr:ABC transporter permease [Phycisphaerae bacterium]